MSAETRRSVGPHLRGPHADLWANISGGEYDAGHMMYINNESLSKLHHDVAGFLEGALKP